MRILIGHNYYQNPGGEDAVFHSHVELLQNKGHDVFVYKRHNDEIKPDFISKSMHAATLRWSNRSYQEIRQHIRAFKPQIAHFHNVFFVMTPSVLYACQAEGVPVIVSLHNFRLMCINGLFFRDHKPCEDCLKISPVCGIKYKCYRGSVVQSLAMTDMMQHHWRRQTWQKHVNRFVVATDFTRHKHVQAGLPQDKVRILPHYVEQQAPLLNQHKGYALYAGRLNEEKGVDVLLKAWGDIKGTPLYIVGSGDQQEKIENYIKENHLNNVKICGFLNQQQYADMLHNAKYLIVPSLCYENFPRVVVEAYSYGVPVIASRLGSLPEIVLEGVTGMLFNAGDGKDLAQQVHRMDSLSLQQYNSLRFEVRRIYEQKYSSLQYYNDLMKIYTEVI